MSQLYLQYGSYSHALSDAAVAISRTGEWNDLGVCYAIREVWSIQGRLIADDQSGVTTAIANLESAYRVSNRNISLRFDGGGTTAHGIAVQNTIDGIRVRVQPSYPVANGADYSTFRHYSIVVEALVKTGLTSSEIVQWEEVVSGQGGQPRDVMIETLNTLPVMQRTANHTVFVVTQSGRAVGLNTWPFASPWIFPYSAVYTNRITRRSPRTTLVGGLRLNRMFETTWQYTFGLAVPTEVIPVTRPL